MLMSCCTLLIWNQWHNGSSLESKRCVMTTHFNTLLYPEGKLKVEVTHFLRFHSGRRWLWLLAGVISCSSGLYSGSKENLGEAVLLGGRPGFFHNCFYLNYFLNNWFLRLQRRTKNKICFLYQFTQPSCIQRSR